MLTVIISRGLANIPFQQTSHEDFLFWLEALRSYPKLRYGCLPSVLAFYCIHNTNLSSSKMLMPLWTYRVFRRFGKSRTSSLRSLGSWMIGHFLSQLKLITTTHAHTTQRNRTEQNGMDWRGTAQNRNRTETTTEPNRREQNRNGSSALRVV